MQLSALVTILRNPKPHSNSSDAVSYPHTLCMPISPDGQNFQLVSEPARLMMLGLCKHCTHISSTYLVNGIVLFRTSIVVLTRQSPLRPWNVSLEQVPFVHIASANLLSNVSRQESPNLTGQVSLPSIFLGSVSSIVLTRLGCPFPPNQSDSRPKPSRFPANIRI